MALAACVYILTAPGHLQSGDMRSELAVAQSMTGGSFRVRPSLPDVYVPSVRATDGRDYSKYGLGQSVLLLPAALAGRLAGCPPDPARCPAAAQRTAEWVASFLDGLLAALAVGMLFLLAVDLGAGLGAAAALGLLFGFGTIEWDYAHDAFDIGPAAVLVLASVLAARRGVVRPGLRWPLVAGAAAGFAILIRIADLAMVPLVAGYLFGALRTAEPGRAFRAVLQFGLPVAMALVVVAIYDWERFGSVLETGYGLSADPVRWQSPLEGGLTGLLFSPGKSIFVFSPVLLASFLGWRELFRRDRWFSLLLLALVTETVILYASFTDWSGDWAWGPRYMVTLTPLLAIPLIPVLERWAALAAGARIALGGLFAFGAAVALLGVCVDYLHQMVLEVLTGRDISAYWTPSASAVWQHLLTLGRILKGDAPYPSYSRAGDVAAGLPPLTTIDFWWVYELVKGTNPVLVLVVVAILALTAARMGRHLLSATGQRQ